MDQPHVILGLYLAFGSYGPRWCVSQDEFFAWKQHRKLSTCVVLILVELHYQTAERVENISRQLGL